MLINSLQKESEKNVDERLGWLKDANTHFLLNDSGLLQTCAYIGCYLVCCDDAAADDDVLGMV